VDAITQTAYARIAGVDPPRIDPRTGLEEAKARIRVVSTSLFHCLPGGHRVELGENFLVVYISDLKKILEGELETATAAEQAEVDREHARQVARWEAKNEGADPRTNPISREASFQHVMGRPMRCIESVKVLEDHKVEERKSAKS
jgi:hypothetical protein